jgi:Zn-dependent protease
MDPAKIVIVLFVLVYSCILHEIAHAWVALKLGDPTGKDMGRITLNPSPHIDPFMTIFLPAMLYFVSNGTYCFGGAKPVSIQPQNFRNPGRGMMLSAAAGPFTNVILAVIGGLLLIVLSRAAPSAIFRYTSEGVPLLTYNGFLFGQITLMNVMLGAFNMVPIPPLDGSRVLRYLLPYRGKLFIDRVERFGLIPVMIFIAVGSNVILTPVFIIVFTILLVGMPPDGFEALRQGMFH